MNFDLTRIKLFLKFVKYKKIKHLAKLFEFLNKMYSCFMMDDDKYRKNKVMEFLYVKTLIKSKEFDTKLNHMTYKCEYLSNMYFIGPVMRSYHNVKYTKMCELKEKFDFMKYYDLSMLELPSNFIKLRGFKYHKDNKQISKEVYSRNHELIRRMKLDYWASEANRLKIEDFYEREEEILAMEPLY